MPVKIKDYIESDLPFHVENNLIAFIEVYTQIAGGHIRRKNNLLQVYSGMAMPYFNGIVQTKLTDESIETAITSEIAFFQRQAQDFVWWIGPSTTPARLLAELLQRHGLRHTSQDVGMAIDLATINKSEPLPNDVIITTVTDAEALRFWLEIYRVGFGLSSHVTEDYGKQMRKLLDYPHLIGPYYLAWLHGQPVGISCLCCGAGVAGIYEVATLPTARRLGIGTALTIAALKEGQKRGYRIGILQATKDGISIYRQIGFQEYATFDSYYWLNESSYGK
jgi:ribosomal protein S18 acetylase RimI-like enzyme